MINLNENPMILAAEKVRAERCVRPDQPPSDTPPAEVVPFSPDPRQIRLHLLRRIHEQSEKISQAAMTGDIQAARAYIAQAERVAKLLGLDAPKEIALEVSRGVSTDPRRMTTEELQRVLAARLSLPENTVFSTEQIELIEGEYRRDDPPV